jgi:hypothetical protein
MKKLFLLLAISLLVLGSNAQARNSADTYDNKYYSQQEFVDAYNATTGPLYRDYVVGIYAAADNGLATGAIPGVNPNSNLGQYVVEATSSTTDNIYAFGVVDASVIPSGQLGRIAIRGPHKVVVSTSFKILTANLSVGTLLSQCASNVDFVPGVTGQIPITQPNTTVVNGGVACIYSTATGTAGATIGYLLNTTATTDTGDVGTATNAQSQGTSTNSEYWAWINPQVLR